MNKPHLILTEERHRSGWDALTWEQRQGYRDRNGARVPVAQGMGMTANELINAMGSAHCQHQDFKEKPRSLLPMPNLAGRQPMIAQYHMSLWKLMLQTIRFALS